MAHPPEAAISTPVSDTPVIVYDKDTESYREGVISNTDEALAGAACLTCGGALVCAGLALITGLDPEARGLSGLFGSGAFVLGTAFSRLKQNVNRPHVLLSGDKAKQLPFKKVLLNRNEVPLLTSSLTQADEAPLPGFELTGRRVVLFPRIFTPPPDSDLFRLEKYSFNVSGDGENTAPVEDDFLVGYPAYRFEYEDLRVVLTDEMTWPSVLDRLGYLEEGSQQTVRYLQGRVHAPSGLRDSSKSAWGFYSQKVRTRDDTVEVRFAPFDLSIPFHETTWKETARLQRASHVEAATKLFPPDSVERSRRIEALRLALSQEKDPAAKKKTVGSLLVLLAFTTDNNQRLEISRALAGHFDLTSAHFLLHHGLGAVSEEETRKEITQVLTEYADQSQDQSILSFEATTQSAPGRSVFVSAGSCYPEMVTLYQAQLTSVPRSDFTKLYQPQMSD